MYLHPPGFYEEQGIEMRLGTEAVALDARRRTVTLNNGEELASHKLLLATGVRPRKLPIPGAELAGVYYLCTLADAEAIRNEAVAGRHAVIIGGGFIGVEVAASLSQMGVKTTIVNRDQTIWAHLFGESMGRFFHEALQQRNVRIVTQAHVQRIEGEARAQRVVTQEGDILPCDFVVIGVGATPETTLAEAAGLDVDNGIVVNEYLETSEHGIFAAGDNASFFSPLFDAQMRVEHWDAANQQGVTAAFNMLGEHRPSDHVPYFFSGLFDIWLEFLGYAPRWDRLIVRRVGPERFTAFFAQESYIRGALLVNNSKELAACRELISRKQPVDDLARLEDPNYDIAQPMRSLTAASTSNASLLI
jgi:3-phenylpropionate/trans-cinnamate dioxygenase ferredoxin reductase subunit